MFKKTLFLFLICFNFSVYAQLSDCDTVFWTIEPNGTIRGWNLSGETITGGTIEVIAPIALSDPLGLAYCNNNGVNTFFVAAAGMIKKYTGNNTWQDISLSMNAGKNGGYRSDQYFLYARTLYYFNGSTLDEIVALPDTQIFTSDIAVDTGGRAWVFVGSGFSITNYINVYDRNGLVISYPFTLDTYGSSGSFFLNDVLYFGGSSSARPWLRNKITPIMINGDSVIVGTGIPFTSGSVHMASCNSNTLSTAQFSEEDAVQIYPNPTTAVINVKSSKPINELVLYTLTGQLIQSTKGNDIDLSAFADGLYLLKIMTADGVISKLIKKE